jgi:hypothetical protein
MSFQSRLDWCWRMNFQNGSIMQLLTGDLGFSICRPHHMATLVCPIVQQLVYPRESKRRKRERERERKRETKS